MISAPHHLHRVAGVHIQSRGGTGSASAAPSARASSSRVTRASQNGVCSLVVRWRCQTWAASEASDLYLASSSAAATWLSVCNRINFISSSGFYPWAFGRQSLIRCWEGCCGSGSVVVQRRLVWSSAEGRPTRCRGEKSTLSICMDIADTTHIPRNPSACTIILYDRPHPSVHALLPGAVRVVGCFMCSLYNRQTLMYYCVLPNLECTSCPVRDRVKLQCPTARES